MVNVKYAIFFFGFLGLASCSNKDLSISEQVVETLQDSVLLRANEYLKSQPKTVTSYSCSRSAGGVHDFFSEGDYWWPDLENFTQPQSLHTTN